MVSSPPLDPKNFDKVNYVVEAWSTGCDAPWYIYVETMKPAALEAFIVLLSFGWADVVRGRLRPKGLGRRTSKRKGRWNRRIPAFPEIGNTLGKAIPLGEQLEDFVKWGTGTRFLWRIDNLMQAGLFMWLVADVAEDFVFNWTSLLYESYWCQPPVPGRFSYSMNYDDATNGGVWQVMTLPTKDYADSPPNWTGQIGWSGPNGCTVAAAFAVRSLPQFEKVKEFGVQVRVYQEDEVLLETGMEAADADGNLRLPIAGSIRPNVSFTVRTKHDSQWAVCYDGAVMAVETVNR